MHVGRKTGPRALTDRLRRIELGTGEVTCKAQMNADLARKKEEIFNAVTASEEPLSKRAIERFVRCRR